MEYIKPNTKYKLKNRISKQKQLIEYEMKFKAVFNHAHDAIFIYEFPIDMQSVHFLEVNDTACRRLGYSRDELLRLGPLDLMAAHDGYNFPDLLQTLKERGEVFIEHAYMSKSGTPLPVEIHSRVIPIHDKRWIISVARDITSRKQVESDIHHMAFHDFLTDLPNRRLFQLELDKKLAMLKANEQAAILFVDLDRFKYVNDTFGHSYGDNLLHIVTTRLKASAGQYGLIARMGGDEFTVLLPETGKEAATQIAERILVELQSPILIGQQEFYISASIGIAFAPKHGMDAETLMKHADHAMYEAKARGRNTYEIYQATNLEERYIMESELRKAIAQDEFFLVYQPRMNLKTGSIVGMEALIRWNHPKKGLIPPDRFIPLAEETGLILPLGKWVLHEACRQRKQWDSQGFRNMRVSVNLSAIQLKSKHLLRDLESIILETKLDPKWLELEITESALMENISVAAQTLQDIKAMGIRVSIDDFGTGYSSLKYLQHLPVDALKIDRSFTQEIKRGEKAAIPRSIVQLAHTLQMEVVAEGVETLEQFEFLVEHRCDEIQGYYLEKPLLPDELKKFLAPWIQEYQS